MGDVMDGITGGPAELVLMARVARRHYLEGRSKVEIAGELGISRFKVARLIDRALATGLVKIDIAAPGEYDVETAGRVQDVFGLGHVVVVATADTHRPALRQHLGAVAARLLEEIATADDVLGLAWSRSLVNMGSALTRLPGCEVVQLTGVLQQPGMAESSLELVREVARAGGGPARYFYAPMIVPSAETARALRQQPEIASAFARLPAVTIAMVGIGSWSPPASTVYEAITPQEQQELRALGVVGEISGNLIGADGTPVPSPLSERTIGVTTEQLRAVPTVVATTYGVEKVAAVRASLRAGFLTGLIIDSALGRALLTSVDAVAP